jgi:hypothetical protein
LRCWSDQYSLQLFFSYGNVSFSSYRARRTRYCYSLSLKPATLQKGMHIQITITTLALLTGAMFFLRAFWLRVPPRWRFFLIRASIALIVVHGLFLATKWNTTSSRLNAVINWLAVAGYELLVMLFSRLRPRWLTLSSAVILLVPLFAASILFPLAELFDPDFGRFVPMGNHLFYEVSPWSNGGSTPGVDVRIYYRPPLIPVLRHKVQTVSFNDQECNANAAFAVPGPSAKTVLGRCPNWPSQSTGTLDRLSSLP